MYLHLTQTYNHQSILELDIIAAVDHDPHVPPPHTDIQWYYLGHIAVSPGSWVCQVKALNIL